MRSVMVVGAWDEAAPHVLEAARQVGASIASNGWSVITGGGSGIAAAAAAGAVEEKGVAIAFIGQNRLTDLEPDINALHTVRIYTDSGWDGRSLVAVKSCDAVVVVGGKNGTLLEVCTAYLHNTPIVVLKGTSELVDRLEVFAKDGYIDERKNVQMMFVDNVAEASLVLQKILK